MASWSDKRFVRLRQLLRFTGNLLVPILLFSEFYQNFLFLKRKTNLSNSSKVFFRTQGPKWCISVTSKLWLQSYTIVLVISTLSKRGSIFFAFIHQSLHGGHHPQLFGWRRFDSALGQIETGGKLTIRSSCLLNTLRILMGLVIMATATRWTVSSFFRFGLT